MKRKTITTIKTLLLAGGFLSASLFLFSFSGSRRLAGDIWEQLGLTREQGTGNIRESFLNGYLRYYGAKNLKNIAAGNRVAVAKDLLVYSKQYIGSETFRKAYEQQRTAAKPTEPVVKNRTLEDVRKEKIAETEKSIRDIKESMKTMKPDMVKLMQPGLEMHENNLKEYKKPDSEMIRLFYEGEQQNNARTKQSYQEALAQWEQDYPADYRQLVKRRLQAFLDLSATVDFTAELKEVGSKKKFVNPQYEAKPANWKQVFRAGKDVTDLTRNFAQQWLSELK
jgi:hypothetical protein